MYITLIRPSISYNKTYFGRTVLPPLNLLMLAACTPEKHKIKIVDSIVEEIVVPEETSVVGITVPTTAYAMRAYEIADKYREMGKYVVLGGMHPSVLTEEALSHADTVIQGEAETAWPEFLRDFENGNPQKTYKQPRPNTLDQLPFPKHSLINPKNYIIPNMVQATRGCHRSCTYCSISSFSERTHRCRPVSSVVEEISLLLDSKAKSSKKYLHSLDNFVFIVDDNLFGNMNYAKELMEALVPLKIKWGSQVPIEYFANKEIMELAVESGCSFIAAGLESTSLEALNEAKRKGIDTEKLKTIFKNLATHKITPLIHFIFGFDNDTLNIFDDTCNYALELAIPLVAFHILTPYPGTPLFTQMDKQGRILSKDWTKYDAKHVVFRPSHMTPEQLKSGFSKSWKMFYQSQSISSRLRANKPFKASNLIFNLGNKFFISKHMAE